MGIAKPICLIKVDSRSHKNCRGIIEVYEVQKILDERLNDYHVLVVPFEQPDDEYFEPMQLQVFYEKDFTKIQYQELKEIIEKSLQQNIKQLHDKSK